MKEGDKRTIGELLAAYSDISVSREQVGDMTVLIGGGNKPEKRLYLSLRRDTPGEVKPHLTIAILPEKRGGGWVKIKIFPVSPENARVEVEGLPCEVDSQEIIRKAKEGLELFKEAEAVGFVDVPQDRIYDRMHRMPAGDERCMLRPFIEEELKIAKKAGLPITEIKYAHPGQYYLYMLEVLALKVG